MGFDTFEINLVLYVFQINATNVRNRQFVEDILANTRGRSMKWGTKCLVHCNQNFEILMRKNRLVHFKINLVYFFRCGC